MSSLYPITREEAQRLRNAAMRAAHQKEKALTHGYLERMLPIVLSEEQRNGRYRDVMPQQIPAWMAAVRAHTGRRSGVPVNSKPVSQQTGALPANADWWRKPGLNSGRRTGETQLELFERITEEHDGILPPDWWMARHYKVKNPSAFRSSVRKQLGVELIALENEAFQVVKPEQVVVTKEPESSSKSSLMQDIESWLELGLEMLRRHMEADK